MSKESSKRIRKASGSVNSSDKLVGFLYLLGRDYLPLGTIESIMITLSEGRDPDVMCFSNGWLATYAKDVAKRLKKGKQMDGK